MGKQEKDEEEEDLKRRRFKKRNKKGKKTSNQSREEKSSESILEDGKSKALTLNFSLKVRLTQNGKYVDHGKFSLKIDLI